MDIKFVLKIMIVSVCVCVMCPREDSMTKILCKQMYKTKHIIIKFSQFFIFIVQQMFLLFYVRHYWVFFFFVVKYVWFHKCILVFHYYEIRRLLRLLVLSVLKQCFFKYGSFTQISCEYSLIIACAATYTTILVYL